MSESRPPTSPVAHPPQSQQGRPMQAPLHPQPPRAPAPSGLPKVGALPTQTHKSEEIDLDPIGLVEEATSDVDEKKIKAFGIIGSHRSREWKRKPFTTGQGAVRVKSFHGKLSDQGMQYIDDAVNDWLDSQDRKSVV